MTRRTLRLTLDVTYEIDPCELNVEDQVLDLAHNLRQIVTRASRDGWLTEDTDATVVVANPHVVLL